MRSTSSSIGPVKDETSTTMLKLMRCVTPRSAWNAPISTSTIWSRTEIRSNAPDAAVASARSDGWAKARRTSEVINLDPFGKTVGLSPFRLARCLYQCVLRQARAQKRPIPTVVLVRSRPNIVAIKNVNPDTCRFCINT